LVSSCKVTEKKGENHPFPAFLTFGKIRFNTFLPDSLAYFEKENRRLEIRENFGCL